MSKHEYSPIPAVIDNQKVLEHFGWTVECRSPYEIRHTDGSRATLNAAKIVELTVVKEFIDSLAATNLSDFRNGEYQGVED